jgi:hypothetical protein
MGGTFWDVKGTNDWQTHAQEVESDATISSVQINRVRIDKVNDYVNQNLVNFRYRALSYNCASATSAALNASGVFNIPIPHPLFIHMQMLIRRYNYLTYLLNNR